VAGGVSEDGAGFRPVDGEGGGSRRHIRKGTIYFDSSTGRTEEI